MNTEVNAPRIEQLERIVAIVKVAREEGWYEDHGGWAEVDKLLTELQTCTRSVGEKPVA